MAIRILTLAATVLVSAAGAFAQGGLSGKVIYHGKSLRPFPINMSAFPPCMVDHPNGFAFSPLVVSPEGGVYDAFVYVEKGLDNKKFPTPSQPVVLDQKGCWYHPHVFGIMAGQTLEIINSDKTMHNINGQPYFNVAMPPGVPPTDQDIPKPQVMFPVHCNIHPWMHAFVGVMNNPYYAVTNKEGRFEIKDLPPGTYTIGVWQEKLGKISKEVTVPGTVDLMFK